MSQHHVTRLGAALLLVAAASTTLQAQKVPYVPLWEPTFGGMPHKGDVFALATGSPAGGGPEVLYVGGSFGYSGLQYPAENIEMWDGWKLSPLGAGTDGIVRAIVVDETARGGPVVYAGGDFTMAGGAPASRIAMWDGTAWSPLGSGMNGRVLALEVYDDGTGPALYAGGEFSTAGGASTGRVAKWDGVAWTSVGGGVPGDVRSLEVFDDGNGPALYAAGWFSTAGGVSAKGVARWDGATWSALSASTNFADTLVACELDGAPALLVGGTFSSQGGVAAKGVAKWDGSAWSGFGAGLGNHVNGLAVYDDGGGPAVYATGDFPVQGQLEHIAKWDGAAWVSVDGGLSQFGYALAVYDGGDGEELYVGGLFFDAGETFVRGLGRWDGAAWHGIGAGPSEPASAVAVFDDGGGPDVYVSGRFAVPYGSGSVSIARWDGHELVTIATGSNKYPNCLLVHDQGGGPQLVGGGDFTTWAGVAASRIIAWDGATWSPLGAGFDDGIVLALAAFDDGNGPALYAGGSFTASGGQPVSRVARWDGSTWSPLGAGLDGTVNALEVFDDGNGPALYAGGSFTMAGGQPALRVAKWDGAAWSPLGAGTSGTVRALAAYDTPFPRLYVGGSFLTAGGQALPYLARWDGSAWSSANTVLDGEVRVLEAVEDPAGGFNERLAVGGTFAHIGAQPASRIAFTNGVSWWALGSGLDGAPRAMASFDDGSLAPALYVAGSFVTVIDSGDSFLGRYVALDPLAFTSLGYSLGGVAGHPVFKGSGSLAPGSFGSLLLSKAAPAAPALLVVAFAGTPTPFKGGTLVPVPVAFSLPLATHAGGGLELGWIDWPAGLPPGTALYFQMAIQDAAAVAGVSLSNALTVTTP